MTHRERRERRAARLRGWAEKRETKAADLEARNEPFRGDIAFNTQPGHIPERARAIRRTEKAVEHTLTAKRHNERAGNIESQLDRSIYDDDPDAIERLEYRIADLEAERDRVKRFNATARKGEPDFSILTEPEKQSLLSAVSVWGGDKKGRPVFPSYHLSNLSGNINRNRKRLDAFRRAER